MDCAQSVAKALPLPTEASQTLPLHSGTASASASAEAGAKSIGVFVASLHKEYHQFLKDYFAAGAHVPPGCTVQVYR